MWEAAAEWGVQTNQVTPPTNSEQRAINVQLGTSLCPLLFKNNYCETK